MQNDRSPFPSTTAPTEVWERWVQADPVAALLGLRCRSVAPGQAELALDGSHWPANPNGAVHGGMVVTAADHCRGIVTTTVLSPGEVPATISLSAQFLRPAMPPLTLRARVDRAGRTLVFATVEVLDSADRMAALVIGTLQRNRSSL